MKKGEIITHCLEDYKQGKTLGEVLISACDETSKEERQRALNLYCLSRCEREACSGNKTCDGYDIFKECLNTIQ